MDRLDKRIHIAVVSQALSLRLGLRALLSEEDEFEVTLEAASLTDPALLAARPDLVLFAGRFPAGFELEDFLEHQEQGTGFLALVTEPVAARSLPALLSLRAWGVVSLESSAQELGAAVRAVAAGLWVADPALTAGFFARSPASLADPDNAHIEGLTLREIEVLQHLAAGEANKQIALALQVSENTIKFHISSIYTKLGAGNRAEAVRLGLQSGYISL